MTLKRLKGVLMMYTFWGPHPHNFLNLRPVAFPFGGRIFYVGNTFVFHSSSTRSSSHHNPFAHRIYGLVCKRAP